MLGRLTNTFFTTWDGIKNNVILHWLDVTDVNGEHGLALLTRLFNAAGDDHARRLSLDGRAGKAGLIELNGERRESLSPTMKPDGWTTRKIAIPRFGVRTLKVDDYAN